MLYNKLSVNTLFYNISIQASAYIKVFTSLYGGGFFEGANSRILGNFFQGSKVPANIA